MSRESSLNAPTWNSNFKRTQGSLEEFKFTQRNINWGIYKQEYSYFSRHFTLTVVESMRIRIVFLIIATTFTTFLNISSTWSHPKIIQNKSVGEIKYKYCRFQARRSILGLKGWKGYVPSWGQRAFVHNHFWRIH